MITDEMLDKLKLMGRIKIDGMNVQAIRQRVSRFHKKNSDKRIVVLSAINELVRIK
ncbi:MAG: hypothetical protein [Caudoviricetes sp.]|nr:MAG: hypothetical protein [Caudoviricetes sp.]